MNTSTTLVTLAAVTLALTACNRTDTNRTTSVPPAVNTTSVMQPLVTPSAPPASADRGPVAASANAAAPGTNAALAFANEQGAKTAPAKATAGPQQEAVAVNAQEAAAKAPDTAAADAAKDDAKQGATAGLRTPGTGTETSANEPRHGDLTKAEESNQMPKAGQANNYSSTALEEDSGRGRKP
jgi:hypothetical protein